MEIYGRLLEYHATPEEAERSLGLFLRSSLLARILGISEIYQQIVNLPGVILDIGTWRGQTAVLCENFRAIYEPLHFNRRIICFDTFEGYKGFSEKDKATDLHQEGTYSIDQTEYENYLAELLILHERSNAMGHNSGKHTVIKGDCRETIPDYFSNNPNEFVSLAFFDVNSYEVTKSAFETVYQKVVPGGVLAFWQLTRNTIPAEGRFYVENLLDKKHTVQRTQSYPGLCFIKKQF
jgi:hypothetical protein